MKSRTTTAEEKVSGPHRGQEREAAVHFNSTHASTEFGDPDPGDRQNEQTYPYNGSPLPAYFAFDTRLQDHLQPPTSSAWSTFHQTMVRSSTQPFSIYGTSSEYAIAEDISFEPALPSPISSLGSRGIVTPFNSSTMIWEQLSASEGPGPINIDSPFHIISQGHHHELDEEMNILEEDEWPANSELCPVLPTNSRSSSLSTTGGVTESSATSQCITLEEPEMPPAKRPRISPPSPRWSTTTRQMRRKKLEQTTIIFPQSPPSSAPKTNHNAIEKQYRNRLNDKFEALLSVLPEQETESGRGSLAKVSKGDVLILAKDYIESLEKSRDELQEDHRLLQHDVKDMKEAWLQSGGRVLR